MKKLILFLLPLIFMAQLLFSQSTSNGTGDWNSNSTWSGGAIPTVSDDVTVASGDRVTVSTVQDCKSITIEPGGTLKLMSGALLSTSSTVTVNGTLTVEAGTFNAGTSKSKFFYVSGGVLNFSGGTINVGGRYSQKSVGNAFLSGDAVLNLATEGEQSTKTYNIFSVTTSGVFSVASGSTVKIVLQNGNSGAAYEVHYSPGTSDFNGGSFVIQNNSAVPNMYFDCDVPIHNLIVNVGLEDTLHFTSSSNVKMNDFTNQSGQVVADAGTRLEIDGNPSLGADGKLCCEINSSAAASVYFAQSPSAKVKADFRLDPAKFHYISAPVTESKTFSNLNMGLTGGTGNDSFFYWDEAKEYNGVTGSWVDILNGEDGTGAHPLMGSGTFQTAKGYTIRYQHAVHTLSLTGNVLTADMAIAATSTSGSTGQGWNLIGNPFSASIAANRSSGTNNFLDVNASLLDPVFGGVYVWNEKSSYEGKRNDYLPVSNSSGVMNISAGQAFMVKVKSSCNISFPANIQNNDRSATFYKADTASTWTRCWFDLSRKGQVKSETLIAFKNGMTQGLDPTYDAGLLRGSSKVDLFTRLVQDNGYDFAIQALPPPGTPENVKVGIDVDSTGDYVLSLARDENLGDSISIFLKDKKTGAWVDLGKNKEYSFTLGAKGRISDRFILYFNQGITGTPSYTARKESSPVSMKVIQHQIYVEDIANHPVQCTIEMVNVLGQKIFSQNLSLSAGQLYSQRIPDVKGLMIISLFNGSFQKSKKVIF